MRGCGKHGMIACNFGMLTSYARFVAEQVSDPGNTVAFPIHQYRRCAVVPYFARDCDTCSEPRD